jgi:autotransporter-associated beta strand protein
MTIAPRWRTLHTINKGSVRERVDLFKKLAKEERETKMKTITTQWMTTVAFLAIVMTLLPSVSYAVDKIWTGASSTAWGTSGNWNPSGVPSSVDTVIFDGTGNNYTNVSLGGSRTLSTLSFTTEQTNGVTIRGTADTHTLTFTNGSGTKISVAAGNHIIVAYTNTSSDNFVLFYADAITNDIASGASLEIAGRIPKRPQTGSGGTGVLNYYTKIGGGTLILSGNNGSSSAWQFNGGDGFKVQEGVLRFANNNAPGNSGNNFLVSSGAAIELTNNITSSIATGTWTINGTGIGNNGAIRSTSTGTSTLSSSGTGTITLGSNSSIGVDNGTLNVKRVISGSVTRKLTKVGAGTLVLSTNNTYTGATTVESGTLSLGINSSLSSSNAVTLAGGTLAMNTYSNAFGALTLSGDATIALGDGTGNLSFTNSSSIAWSGKLTLTGTLGEKTLRFGQDKNGLSDVQKSKLTWNGGPLILDNNGYVIKRPGTLVMFF